MINHCHLSVGEVQYFCKVKKINKILKYKMYDSCRICLSEINEADCSSVYHRMTEDKSVLDIIKECSSIEIAEDDHLPKLVCPECIEKLDSLYKFRNLIIKSDLDLKEKLDIKKELFDDPPDCIIEDVDVSADDVFEENEPIERCRPSEVFENDCREDLLSEVKIDLMQPQEIHAEEKDIDIKDSELKEEFSSAKSIEFDIQDLEVTSLHALQIEEELSERQRIKLFLEQDSPKTKVTRYLMESEITSAELESYFKPKTTTDPIQIAAEDISCLNTTCITTNDMRQPGAEGYLMGSETIQVQEELPASSSKENSSSVCQTTSDNLINESNKRRYIKSASARERPTICPICSDDVITHFTRHLFRRHSDDKQVKLIKSLKPRSKERLDLVSTLRKQGYFRLKKEKDILNPVKPSKLPSIEYYICQFCLGYYKKSLLHKHVKICKSKPDTVTNPGRNCLSKSQTFMALASLKDREFLKSSRITKEVLEIMRPDEISAACIADPLICLYGEALLTKYKRQQFVTVVSNKIREMARLTIALKSIHPEVNGLFDLMSPDMFQTIVMATKMICGYDEARKTFKSPSLAVHMGTNLKMVCDIAYKLVLENRKFPNIKWTDRTQTKTNIKDLKRLIEGHWCVEISSLALKNLQERQREKPTTLPSTSDIQLFRGYIHNLSEKAFHELNNNTNIQSNYKMLTECVLVLTVMFNRKRLGDVQYLKVETYNKDWSAVNQDAFIESLTPLERIMCKRFKRVVVGGEGSKTVPVLFSTELQNYIACLLQVRKKYSLVPESNPYLFANVGSENRWMSGINVIRKMAKNCGAKNPASLTSTKFRKHIATILQLMDVGEDEIEQIATFLGHTKENHEEFYRLPQDIYRAAKVAKVLILLEKGKGNQFRGKKLAEIDLENDIYYSSDSDDEEQLQSPLPEKKILSENGDFTNRTLNKKMVIDSPYERLTSKSSLPDRKQLETDNTDMTLTYRQIEQDTIIEQNDKKSKAPVKSNFRSRSRWSVEEKKLVLEYFHSHVKNKITPKKRECERLLSSHKRLLVDKDWIKVKTLVYNSFRVK